ncbi:hypothetical protein, partial [Acidilobus sp.]|uniref:hypothetical protein n=1 Tax=Acidilobus sp. TaxID=1872109 RepID=UPI003CFD2963
MGRSTAYETHIIIDGSREYTTALPYLCTQSSAQPISLPVLMFACGPVPLYTAMNRVPSGVGAHAHT